MDFKKLHDVAVYIFKMYSKDTRFSRARFVKLIYLSDWKHTIEHGNQITNIEWYFHNYGPYVPEIIDALAIDPDFQIINGENLWGEPNIAIALKNPLASYNLSESEEEAIRFIVNKTQKMSWDNFINLVYSTYPVRVSARHSHMDLVELAREYQPLRKRIETAY